MSKDGFGEPYRHWAEARRKPAKPHPFLRPAIRDYHEWQAALSAKVLSAFGVPKSLVGLSGRWPYGTVIEHRAGLRAMYVGRKNQYLHSIIRLSGGMARLGDEREIDNNIIENWREIDG